MRRNTLGAVAVWLAGGAALAADGATVQILGLTPDQPTPAPFPAVTPPPGGLPPGQHLVPLAGRQAQPGRNLQPIVQVSAPGTAAQPAAPPPVFQAEPLPQPAMDAAPVVEGSDCSAAAGRDAENWFGSLDYLAFWVRRNPTPGLVQVLPANLANFEATGGALPPDAAITIFGANGTDPGRFDGVRAQLGMWLTPNHCWGVDASYLQLKEQADSFFIASQGEPVIGRGFTDAGVNTSAFLRYTTPDGLSTGFIGVDAPVEMYTFDMNLRRQGPSVFTDRVDYLAGVRYLDLRDSVTIDSGASVRADPGAAPFNITSHESFRATNQFYGAQVGFDSHSHYGCWTLDVSGKLAAGWVQQEVNIAGFATTQQGTAATVLLPNESILYVQRSNAGSYSRDRFAVLPEFLVKLGYQITPHIRAAVGYNILSLSSVQRSGAAIDPSVNPSLARFITVQQASDVSRPAFGFRGTDFWAQGITLGLTVTY